MKLRAVQKFMKIVLFRNMDAMACDMDCHRKIHVAIHILKMAAMDIEKSLQYEKVNNSEIEGQLCLLKEEDTPLKESA